MTKIVSINKENFKVNVYSQLDTFIDDVMSEAEDCYTNKCDEQKLKKLYKKLFNNIFVNIIHFI